MTLDDLIAAESIRGLVFAYVKALDEKDWVALRELFTDHVDIDAAGIHGGPPVRLTRDEWVQRARSTVERFDTTLHYVTNLEVSLDGDTGTCRSYGYAVHGRDGDPVQDRFVVHGIYVHGAVRSAGQWRLSSVKLDFQFRDGVLPPLREA